MTYPTPESISEGLRLKHLREVGSSESQDGAIVETKDFVVRAMSLYDPAGSRIVCQVFEKQR